MHCNFRHLWEMLYFKFNYCKISRHVNLGRQLVGDTLGRGVFCVNEVGVQSYICQGVPGSAY